MDTEVVATTDVIARTHVMKDINEAFAICNGLSLLGIPHTMEYASIGTHTISFNVSGKATEIEIRSAIPRAKRLSELETQ